MNLFGSDILQLIFYVCVVAIVIVVVYIFKLTRNKTKIRTEMEHEPHEDEENEDKLEPQQLSYEEIGDKAIIQQLIALIDKMYSHQNGLNPTSSCPKPNPEPTPTKKRIRKKREEEKKPEPDKKPETKETPPLPTQSHSIQQIDEETYTSTEEDKELLENIRKQIGAK